MEDQPIGQSVDQTMTSAAVQPAAPASHAVMWFAALAVLVLAFGAMYFVWQQPAADDAAIGADTAPEAALPAATDGTTVADISADLTQLEGASAGLDADASATEGDIQGL